MERESPFNHATSHLRYGISDTKPPLYSDVSNQKDVRSLTGRVIILPRKAYLFLIKSLLLISLEPVFDLKATVGQVTSNLPKGFSFPDVGLAVSHHAIYTLLTFLGPNRYFKSHASGPSQFKTHSYHCSSN